MSESPKRKAYSVEEKLAVVDRVKNGESQAKVCRELNLAGGTLRGWLKDEGKLREFVHSVDETGGLARKRARKAKDDDLDKSLYTWFVQQQQSGVPLSGPIVAAQAEKFDRQLNGPDSEFKASSGWLWRFLKRHGIGQITLSGEIRSADNEAADAYPATLKTIIEEGGYVDEQIYNTDETGVYYKMLPDKTLAVKSDEHRKEGFKAIKDRLTLLFTVNKTGSHKLKPLCIGKSRAPRCFHHVNMKALPFIHANSKNAWMTSDIFEDWFHNSFVPEVRKHLRSLKLPEKAILLLDNCPAHPPADVLKTRDGRIKVAYLPKNTTSLIQPLDQGIIATFKKNYRRELVSKIISNEQQSVIEFLKGMSIKDFFYIGASAWNAVTPKTIEGCWMRGLGAAFTVPNLETRSETDSIDQINDSSDDEEFHGFSAEEVMEVSERQVRRFQEALVNEGLDVALDDVNVWLNIDESAPTTTTLSDAEIVSAVTEISEPVESDNDEEDSSMAPAEAKIPSAKEAAAALELALTWMETQQISSVKIMQVQNIITFARRAEQSSKKQSRVTDFFQKK